jgi:hypothetical protein
MSTVSFAGLPDLFQFQDGRRLIQPSDWPARRQELFDRIIDIEYGGFPAAPCQVVAEELITHQAAREVFRLLGVEDRLGIWYRPGGHSHTLIDWQALLAFADCTFRSQTPNRSFNPNPFPELR